MFLLRALALTFVGVLGLWIAAAQAQTTEAVREPVKEPVKEEAKKETAKESPVDPTGTWKWQFEFGENKMDAKLKLNWDGKKLAGKYTAREMSTDIRDGKLEKDELTFTTLREFNGNEFEIQFKGQVKQDEIIGNVTLDFGQAQDFDWDAKRAVEVDDVLGVWDLQIDTPNGVVEPKLTITKGEKDTLQGNYVSIFGEREPKNLAIKDNQLTWEVSSDDGDDFDFKIVYKGRPRGNKIEGKSEFEFGDNTGTMEFVGKRTPPKEKKNAERPVEARPAVPATESKPAAAAGEAEPATPTAAESEAKQ